MTATQYRAWLVDLDGTLYVARWVKLAMAVELLVGGRRSLATVREFRRQHERLRAELDSESARSPFLVQLERTAQRLDLGVDAVEAQVNTWMIARPCKWVSAFRRRGLLADLTRFHEGGGRLALVSDYPARAKLAALDATHLFDVVIANGEPGGPTRLKPAADGYLEAARRLGVDPAECLVIGDRDDADGAAARTAGMAFRQVG